MKFGWIVLTVLFLVACQGEEDKQGESTSETENEQINECVAENLIQNPGFALAENQIEPAIWKASQHSGELSFKTSVDAGVLTISKIATQPWFTFLQTLDAREWAGERLRYSADLKLDLDDKGWIHNLEPGGGLYLLVYGDNDPIGGDRLLLDLNLEHEPRLGTTDWVSASIDFTIPEKPTRVVIGFMHQANGSMSVRNPALAFCGE